jgi:hypothetical protein
MRVDSTDMAPQFFRRSFGQKKRGSEVASLSTGVTEKSLVKSEMPSNDVAVHGELLNWAKIRCFFGF